MDCIDPDFVEDCAGLGFTEEDCTELGLIDLIEVVCTELGFTDDWAELGFTEVVCIVLGFIDVDCTGFEKVD